MKLEKISKRLYIAPKIEIITHCETTMLASTLTDPIVVDESGEIQSGGSGSPNSATSKKWGASFEDEFTDKSWGNLWHGSKKRR